MAQAHKVKVCFISRHQQAQKRILVSNCRVGKNGRPYSNDTALSIYLKYIYTIKSIVDKTLFIGFFNL